MNANTMPGYVLGVVRKDGHPLQLINAFEKPVSSRNGLMEASVSALKQHWEQSKATWGIDPWLEIEIPSSPLARFCTEILTRV
jgi:CRISPR system Cascade subunit CasC